MAEKRAFLIQSSGEMAKHETVTFSDRTYADEVCTHGYYRHETWDTKTRDEDFGKVRRGDYVLQYCTSDVETYPRQIRNMFEVVDVERIDDDIQKALAKGRITKEQAERLDKAPHVIRLRTHLVLNKGLELPLIRKWVEEGVLSRAMNNCGGRGFNICEVQWNDYEEIVEWNKSQPPEPGVTLGDMLEEEVRGYVASMPTISQMFGEEYNGYRLYREPDGRVTGELYDTGTVGVIDLLYQNDAGDFLVVELKRTEDTADKVVGQIARYLGWVSENLAGTKKVEGLLVARSASEELRYAVRALKHCKLLNYEIQFKFHSV